MPSPRRTHIPEAWPRGMRSEVAASYVGLSEGVFLRERGGRTKAKHMNRYVGEFTFRLNEGDVKRHTLERLASLTTVSFGSRITYKELIA